MQSERENSDQHRTWMNEWIFNMPGIIIIIIMIVTLTATAGFTCVLYRKSLPKNEKRQRSF